VPRELLWRPHEYLLRESWGIAQQSRIGRFLGLSTALHVVVAALSPWLLLTFALSGRQEQLVIRTVDFFPSPESAAPGPRTETKPRNSGGPPALKPPAAKAAVTAAPPEQSAPPPESSATPAPTAPASDPSAALPAPREVGVGPVTPRATGPAPVAPAPVTAPRAASDGSADAGRVAALAREIGAGSGAGPVATISIPRELQRGSGEGAGGGGSGAGAGPSPGTAGPNSGSGPGGIDPGDPDFSVYFRIIETRVRAAWTFPENLGGTTQTVKLGFALKLDGSVDDIRVVSTTSGALNESALAAIRRAAPFPPLPTKFRSLVGQPLVMSFTVTIK
jgi:TonB family protein